MKNAPRRGRGRPRIGATPITLRLPPLLHASLVEFCATRGDEPLTEVMRAAVRSYMRQERQMAGEIIKLKVAYHSGTNRFTLEETRSGIRLQTPTGSPLFGNTDAGAFYRAVAQRIADLSQAGHPVDFADTTQI